MDLDELKRLLEKVERAKRNPKDWEALMLARQKLYSAFENAAPQLIQELEAAQERIAQLTAEVERERVRLAGCGVAAMSNTREALERNRLEAGSYGHSASYDDCLRAVEREINERERAEQAEARVRELENQIPPYIMP